jgi:hypothetical protein
MMHLFINLFFPPFLSHPAFLFFVGLCVSGDFFEPFGGVETMLASISELDYNRRYFNARVF